MGRKKKRPLKVRDPFKRDFAKASEAKREKIIAILRTFMAELREVHETAERFARLVPGEKRSSCETCAFNPATDELKGFAPTAYGLLLMILEDKLFVCHRNQPEYEKKLVNPEKVLLCSGFRAARLFGGTQTILVAFRALKEIEQVFKVRRR